MWSALGLFVLTAQFLFGLSSVRMSCFLPTDFNLRRTLKSLDGALWFLSSKGCTVFPWHRHFPNTKA